MGLTKIRLAKSFEKDLKRVLKGQHNAKIKAKITEFITDAQKGRPLPPRWKDHPLKGDKKPLRDVHIKDDLVLLYRLDQEDETTIYELIAIGPHSDLFN